MKIELAAIDTIKPYPNNPRKLSETAIEKVAQSIQEFGFRQPIVVDKDRIIVVGHTRYRASKKLGYKKVPITIAENLTKEQINAYRIADNRTNEEAKWDEELLKMELKELDYKDFDLKMTGFDDKQINDLLFEEKQGLTGDDDVPDTPEEPITKLGDIWQLGKHRLLCGDSTKEEDVNKLMDGQKADMVFTDPPYGYEYLSNHQTKHNKLLNDDKILDFAPTCKEFMFDNSSIFVCGSFQTINKWIDYISQYFSYKNLIVWTKNNWSMGDLKGAFAGQHELIIFAHKGKIELLGKREPDVWNFDRVPPKIHPTQKPVELIKYAMSKVQSGLVLDVFGGSGSTLIACEKSNKINYMMELDPKYCDVIVKRWEQWTGEKATK